MNDLVASFCQRLVPRLPPHVEESVLTTAEEISACRVDSFEALFGASLFYACRFEGAYRTVDIIASNLSENEEEQKKLAKRVRKLIARLEKLCTTSTFRLTYRVRPAYKTPLSIDLVDYACVRLGMGTSLKQAAYKVCIDIHRRNLCGFSPRPASVAGRALFLVSQLSLHSSISSGEIGDILCTSASNVESLYKHERLNRN